MRARRVLALALLGVATSLAWAGELRSIAAADPQVARLGRMVESSGGALRFAYPGVTVSLAFSGTFLSLEAWSSGQHSYLEVTVDGGTPRRIKLTGTPATYTLVEGAAPGPHRVAVMHRSESWHGVVTLARFHADGARSDPAPAPARRMLVLGDSVTCAEGAGERTGNKDASWTDPRRSYGMLAAAALGAQVHLVCHGGRGLVRSWNGRTDEHNLPDFYELAIADAKDPVKWDHGRYQPDLIVSAIGTNDFSTGIPERDHYVGAYVAFVRTLLSRHPQARIVLTEGAILAGDKKRVLQAYIAETVARIKDRRVSAVPSEHHPGDALDAHPTGAQHAAMAADLVQHLKPLMGW